MVEARGDGGIEGKEKEEKTEELMASIDRRERVEEQKWSEAKQARETGREGLSS
ncbi:hypothetical protein ES319_A04G084700v1 [Gossypium barbadense]|uniref:Uncharacterized protein n=2 Tax=Gossypium TaxID=3633 RepID=A0A5J5W5F1_GOSBA|nr:hypothetical protein ES319_A04G084700v1 [Gossypium barbadense]TYH22053.1 hypothetical protein ES288_A04G096000v1 [Gossypium darwinii]